MKFYEKVKNKLQGGIFLDKGFDRQCEYQGLKKGHFQFQGSSGKLNDGTIKLMKGQ